jgi:hypothetical protein
VEDEEKPKKSSNNKKLYTPTSSAAVNNTNHDNIFVIPLSKPRSQVHVVDKSSKGIAGYDSDVKRWEDRGYRLVISEEHMPTDNLSIQTDEGIFHNSRTGITKRVH